MTELTPDQAECAHAAARVHATDSIANSCRRGLLQLRPLLEAARPHAGPTHAPVARALDLAGQVASLADGVLASLEQTRRDLATTMVELADLRAALTVDGVDIRTRYAAALAEIEQLRPIVDAARDYTAACRDGIGVMEAAAELRRTVLDAGGLP